MTWTVTAGTPTVGASSITIPMPSGVTSGDLLVLVMMADAGTVTTTMSGWTAAYSTLSRCRHFYKIAGGSESSVTFAQSGNLKGQVLRCALAGGTSPTPDVSGADTGGTGVTLTLSTADELVICSDTLNAADTTALTFPAGFTSTMNSTANSYSGAVGYAIFASAGSTGSMVFGGGSGTFRDIFNSFQYTASGVLLLNNLFFGSIF